jgi:hypothetical protein
MLPATVSQASTSPDTHPGVHVPGHAVAGVLCDFAVTFSFTYNGRVRVLPGGALRVGEEPDEQDLD